MHQDVCNKVIKPKNLHQIRLPVAEQRQWNIKDFDLQILIKCK